MFGPSDPSPNAAVAVPALPPLRTYSVTRLHPTSDELETHTIAAHMATLISEHVLQFTEFVYDVHAKDGIRQRIIRTFNGWEEYHEDFAPSSLLVPGSSVN